MHKLFCVFLLLSAAVSFGQTSSSQRAIALTFDDLPAAGAQFMTGQEILEMTQKLLGTLRERHVPAVGFVNERKLYKFGEVDDRIKALSLWLDSGFELGNHTYGHMSLNQAEVKDWEEDTIRGETVTSLLLAQHKLKMRYFRHPYLDTGRDLQTRHDAEQFLAQRGYRIAPVTMDAWDWMYSGVYEDARRRGDTSLQQQLVTSYLSHTTEVFNYYEELSRDMLGYEPKQVLLLHSNWLEADHVIELLDLLQTRGYRFITLQDALSDPAYSRPNQYVGEEGTNWLDQWAITRGRPPRNTPVFPQWVVDRSNALRHSPTQP